MSLRFVSGLPLACLLLLAGCRSAPEAAPPAAPPSADVVAIGMVQGSGARSPLLGRTVAIEGVVTGAFADGLDGWFVQDAGDGDPTTSDALFVFTGDLDPALVAGIGQGDRVRVVGRVVEHGPADASLTALQPAQVGRTGRGSVQPRTIDDAPHDWEAHEGMLVRIEAPLTISGHHELERRGVLVASFGGRLVAPTEAAPPGAAAGRVAADNRRRTLLLDDASANDSPARVWYLPDTAQAPRSGSTVAGAEGILDQRWGSYRLQLTAPLALRAAARPQPPQVDGDVRIAALNLQNLFNGDGRGAGFPTPRGARTPAQYRAQLAKLVATVHALDADIVALMELENDGFGPDSSAAQLVAALNRDGADWRIVDSGEGPGSDQIRVGIVHRASRVRPVGDPATLEDGPFAHGSRPPLAQAFVPVAAGRDDGPAFVVVANHFKSKGCGQAAADNRDLGDGQACWNAQRVDSAQRLLAWLDTDPTATGSGLVAVLGDLNSYAQEDPIRVFLDAGWRDAFAGRAPADSYSFVFDGQAGRLDHALLSPALAARLAGAAKWHSNADEPQKVGYRTGNVGESPAEPWRSSDHDPLLAGFRLRARD